MGGEPAVRQTLTAGEPVTLIGAAALCCRYAEALASTSIDVDIYDAEAMTLAGIASFFSTVGTDH